MSIATSYEQNQTNHTLDKPHRTCYTVYSSAQRIPPGRMVHMITIFNERINGDYVCSPISRDSGLFDAMVSLLKYELGFGGKIVEITKERVKIVTHVLSCVDTTTFSGSEEDMLPLVQATLLWAKLSSDEFVVDEILKKSWNMIANKAGTASPLIATKFLPMIVGQSKYIVVMAMIAGIDAVDILKVDNNSDKLAIIQLAAETGKSFGELYSELF